MKVINASVSELQNKILCIGFVGENERTQVRIDASEVFTEYPHATPSLTVKPHSGEAYPVLVNRDGTDVVWDITSSDLTERGEGEIQLTFIKDSVICKSYIGKTLVLRSLTVEGEMPTPVESWVDAATEKLAEVDAQIVELEGMVDTATDAATHAQQSEDNATMAAANAATSAATASTKAAEAHVSEDRATAKAAEAALSATQASNSAVSAADSERGAIAKAAEAAQSAQTATTKAGQATEAAQTATGKAGEASASATAAQASATNAASSATAAQTAQTAAEASETAAGASATQAAQSAQTANTAAQTATQKAAEAATSATNAATSATNAATSAETASTKAGEAAQSAQEAEEAAEQLAESLEQISQNTADIAEHEQAYNALKAATLIHNTASGAIASFVDGAEMPVDSVTAQINPVQDLHGYDNPWPGGGNVNKLNPAEMRAANSTYGFSVTIDGDTFVFSGIYTSTIADPQFRFAYYADARQIPYNLKGFAVDTATAEHYNGFVYKADNSTTLTIRFLNCTQGETYTFRVRVVAYEGDTAPTEWTPYANICPISGFEGLTVTRTGRNLLNPEYRSNTSNNIQFYRDTGYLIKAGETYTLSISGNNANGLYFMLKSGGSNLAFKYNTTSLTYTATEDALVYFNVYYSPAPSGGVSSINCQLELGSTATAYEPYQGATYPITFPSEAGTVYGGSLTVAEDGSGVLTVTKESLVFDSSAWLFSSNFFYKANTVEVGRNVSGYYTAENGIKMYLNSNNGQARIYLADNDFLTSESDVGLMLNGYKLLYDLATPVTYTLTASQITTLLGENNLWHDANGDISVGYKANTKLYVDNKITQAIAAALNS